MTTMTLSEAIKIGAMLGGQCYASWFASDDRTCALGAAWLGSGFSKEEAQKNGRTGARLRARYRVLESTAAGCPECGVSPMAGASVLHTIVHLNDQHRWTRERIADWVATLEAPTPVPVPVEEVDHATV